MRRTIRAALTATSVLVAPAAAQDAISDHIGLFGIGYFSSGAPIGVRYWSGPDTGFDLGFGLRNETEVPILEAGEANTTNVFYYGIEVGYLRVISSDSNMITFIRPGIGVFRDQVIVGVEPPGARGAPSQERDTETRLSVSVLLGVELFMTKFGFGNLSFGGGLGVAFTQISPPGGDTRSVIETMSSDLSVVENANLGFHFYF